MAMEKQEETIKQLQKSSEGTVLALGAIADVLNKMELRFKKQEEEDDAEAAAAEAMAEEEEEELEKSQLIKEITTSVVKQLMDLQGDKPVEVGSDTKHPKDSDSDDAVEAKPRTATTEVQRPIQAMKLRKHDEDEEEEPVEMAYKDHHGEDAEDEIEEALEEIEAQDDEVVEDYPMEEEEDAEDDEVIEEMRLMRKQMSALRKMNTQLQKQIDGVGTQFASATDKKADALMQKMGYRKEASTSPRLVTPQTIAPADVPIVKGEAQSTDVADQLSDLSWSEVWNLRLAKMSGETDGLPKELLG